MKVKIGPYDNWVGPFQISSFLFSWYPKTKDEHGFEREADFIHEFGNWLSGGDERDSLLMKFCNWVHSKKQRKVEIHIDNYDAWNAHNTASLILLPLFKKLKETKHGSGYIDDEDVPESIRSTARNAWTGISEDEKVNMGYSDNHMHTRYEWVLNEILWALEQDNADWEDKFWKTHPEIDLKKYPEDEGKNVIPVRWKVEGECDWKGRQKYQERISNGFRLMGKYWESLWD